MKIEQKGKIYPDPDIMVSSHLIGACSIKIPSSTTKNIQLQLIALEIEYSMSILRFQKNGLLFRIFSNHLIILMGVQHSQVHNYEMVFYKAKR